MEVCGGLFFQRSINIVALSFLKKKKSMLSHHAASFSFVLKFSLKKKKSQIFDFFNGSIKC